MLTLDEMESALADAGDLMEMAIAEEDDEAVSAVVADLEIAEKRIADLEFRRMFSGEMDANNAFLDIQAGSGGTEAQDWAEMPIAADRKSTRLNSSHRGESRMPSSA